MGSPPSFSNNYRSSLAYLPGSVHGASQHMPNSQLPSITTLGNPVFIKQEPEDQHLKRQMQQLHHHGSQNNTYVSSTTHNMTSYMTPGAPQSNGATNGQAAGPNPRPNQQNQPNGNSGNGPTAPPSGGTASLKTFTPNKYPNSSNPPSCGPPVPGERKKKVDRNSDEYRRRRERNNVAVRKSREKAKVRTRETEDRVKILARENERLQKKVELLQEELSVLRSLFSSVGVLPDHIHRELAKHLDNFQAQHAAINY